MSEIDWSALQKEAQSAGLLPDGDYNLVVNEATATTSSTGKPMIKLKMRVLDGPQRDKPVWTQLTLSPENPIALRIFFASMTAFGLDANFFAANPAFEVVAKNLVNRGVTATIGTRPWQGQDRNDVGNFRSLQTAGPVPPGVVTGPAVVGLSGTTVPSPAGPPVPSTPAPAQPAVPVASPASATPSAPGTPPPPKPF